MPSFFSRLLDLVLKRRRDDRLSEELRGHLDLLTEEHIAHGMSAADARLAARKSFGGVDQIAMRYRDQRGFPGLDSLVQDVRFALRVLTRERGFALTAILVLGVGIGVNNIFLTVVYAHKFRGLPISGPDRVLSISTIDDRGADRLLSLAEYEDLRSEQRSFAGIAAWTGGVVTVGDDGRAPDRYDAAYLTANALPLLGVAPILGHGPLPEEGRAGAAPVVMLGVSVWESRYAGNPDILGQSVLVNGVPATVVGIVPERSGFPSTAAVWLPLGQYPGLSPNRQARPLRAYGRLRDGVTESDARHEIEGRFGRLEQAYPESNRNVRARVTPINQRLLGDLGGWGPFIMAGVIVILVACTNVANLMIARAMQRAQEIAIRTSLGASRPRIMRQLLVEATVLAGAGGLVGGLVSLGGMRLVESAIPAGTLPYWFDYFMDARVFVGLVAVSFATVIVFGLVPAAHASRTDVNRTLKDGGRSQTARGGMQLWTGGFLAAELALAMILLTQVALAALMTSTVLPTDDAIHTTRVITTAVSLTGTEYQAPERRREFFRRINQRLSGRAGIAGVSRASSLPGEGLGARRLAVDGRPVSDVTAPNVLTVEIAPSYFSTLDIALIRGREFTDRDGVIDATAIVNDRFADVHLGGVDPIGRRIAVAALNAPADAPPQWLTVVGLVPTIRHQGAGGSAAQEPVVYLPIEATAPVTSVLMVRHAVDPTAVAGLLRTEVQAVDPNVPLYRMRTLAQAVADAMWNRRVGNYLATTVCVLSVLLAIVGLYAVTAQRVTLKTQEIGLRMALGARSIQVVRLVLRELRMPLVFGLLLGCAGAMAWDGAFSSGVAGVYAAAPRTLATIAAFIAAVVLVACFIPLRRATRMNPVAALRHE